MIYKSEVNKYEQFKFYLLGNDIYSIETIE
jgi:hypothetical protein